MTDAPWRITFPIEKAETRSDGLYLIGLASGPEIDAEGERMDRELVHRFADQINSTKGLSLDERLPYRDAHAPDGVLRDLGWLVSASINEQDQLRVEVKLDDDNPAAAFLHRAINKGKKYGMSVAGQVHGVVSEWVAEAGKSVRTFKDVALTEISNTTRPAWTPSFGSVLSKALDDAAEANSLPGVNHVDNEELQQQAETAAGVTEEEAKAASEQASETPAVEETTEATKAEDTEETTASAASKSIASLTPEMTAAIQAAVVAVLQAAVAPVVEETPDPSAEKTDSQDEGATLDKADDAEENPLVKVNKELSETNDELTKRVAELESALKTTIPSVVDGISVHESFEKATADLTPFERLRVAMAASTGGR